MARAPSAGALKHGMAVSVKMKGAKSSARNIENMTKAARQAFFEQMVEIANAILIRSQTKYVPVLSTTLRDSGAVSASPGRYPVVEIGFGGAAASYALVQHENLWFHHPGGKKAKYLELAVKDFEPKIAKALDVAIRHEVKKYDLRGKIVW